MRNLKSEAKRSNAAWLACALTLLAFALRIALLDQRTYWLDEGFTLLRLPLTWSQVLSNFVPLQGIPTTDINPPVYFVLLKAWGLFASDAEFALRLLSAMAMVVAVPATFILIRSMFGGPAALIGAAFAALSPAYQWYGWEIRMYGLMPALAALCMYALHRAVGKHQVRVRWLAIWASLVGLSILTHYTFVAFGAAQGLVALVAFVVQSRRANARRLAAAAAALGTLAAAMFFLPGLSTLTRQMLRVIENGLRGSRDAPASLPALVHETLGATFFGMNAADPSDGPWQFLVGALIAVALVVMFSHGKRRESVLLAVGIAAPILFWIALSYIIPNRPSFRYVIIVLPAIHALLASLMGRLWQHAATMPVKAAAAGVAAATLGASCFGLAQSFVRTETWQDDWRALARHIQREWQPGDAVLINLFVPEPVLKEYLGATPVRIVYVGELLKAAPEAGTALLQQNFGRVWYLNNRRHLESETLARLRPFALTQRLVFNGRTDVLDVQLYSMRPVQLAQLPGTATPVAAQVQNQPTIRGFEVRPGSPHADVPVTTLSLYWQLDGFVDPSTTVSIRLRDRNYDWMAWLLPAELTVRAGSCKPATLCKVDYTLSLPFDLPEKAYTLEMLVGSGAKQEVYQRVAMDLSPQTAACCLRKTATYGPPVAQPGDVRVQRVELPDRPASGEVLPVVITWQLSQPAIAPWKTTLRLQPLFGGPVASQTRPAGPADLPASAWPVNAPFRDPYQLVIPPDAAAGPYRLMLERSRENGTQDAAQLAWLWLRQPEPSPIARNIANPVVARAGELTLLGWGVDGVIARGATLDFHTYWRVDRVPTGDGVIFLHAVREAGKPPVSQDDNPPTRGTRNYRAGEGIDLTHRLTIHDDLPAGEYTLYAGVYERGSAERWPAELNGAPARDNLIKIGSFTLPQR